MKKFFKILGIVVGALVLIVAGFAIWLSAAGIPKYQPAHFTLHVERTPERIARGKKLATLICGNCHGDRTTYQFVGRRMDDAPAAFGTLYIPNITQHPTKGIGTWSDADIAYLLRTGILRNGNFLPIMPRFPHMSDEDLYSIIAFLRSDDPRVAAADVDTPPDDYTLLSKALARFVFKPYPYPQKPIPMPDTVNDKIAWGKYCVELVGCYSCHSADFKTVDELHPEKSEGFFGGGNELIDINGEPIFTPNITPDPETGIGKWSEAQFVRAITVGFRPDNTVLRAPMVQMRAFTSGEVSALYAYLRTVPPLHKPRRRSAYLTLPKSFSSNGQRLYYTYGCVGCHAHDGNGVYDIRKADMKYPTDSLLELKIRKPYLFQSPSAMPYWDGVIREEDYAPLAAFVRWLGRAQSKPSNP